MYFFELHDCGRGTTVEYDSRCAYEIGRTVQGSEMRAVQAVRLVNILVITMFSVYFVLRLAIKMSERPITSFQLSGNI